MVSGRDGAAGTNDVANIALWIEQLVRAEGTSSTVTTIAESILEDIPASVYSTTEMDSDHDHFSQKIAVDLEGEESAFNPEEDFDLDLMISLSKAGKNHYINSNPEQAAENLELALQYAKQLSPTRYMRQDLTEQRLMLSSIALQKQDLNKAEEHLSALLRESVATSQNKEMINDAYLKLAHVYYLKKCGLLFVACTLHNSSMLNITGICKAEALTDCNCLTRTVLVALEDNTM